MRDKIKNKEYFDAYITEDNARVENFQNKLIDGEVAEERIPTIEWKVFDLRLLMLIAKYSRGDEVISLKSEFNELLQMFLNVNNEEFFSYSDNLEFLSLAILLNIDNTSIKKIVEKFFEKDALIDFLANGTISDPKHVLYPKGWKKLFDVILVQNKEEQIKKLMDYINKRWYPINKVEGNLDNHESDQNVYFGYWCFEAGAVAKILKIDDPKLKDQQYYPYDMVHFKG